MNNICTNCGAPLTGTETFCTHCGAPVAASNTVAQDTTVLNTDFKQSLGGEETTVLNNGENGFNPHTNSAYQSSDNFGVPNSEASSQYNAGAYQNTPPNGYTAPNYNQNYNYGNYGSAYGPSNPNIGVIETSQHGFVESYRLFWENYVNFNGRSRRSDYWNVFLWNIIINGVLGLLSLIPVVDVAFSGLAGLFAIASFLPMLALSVRRLQDTGKSGLFYLLNLVPIAGWIVLIVFYCQDSDPGNNQYGESPKYRNNHIY